MSDAVILPFPEPTPIRSLHTYSSLTIAQRNCYKQPSDSFTLTYHSYERFWAYKKITLILKTFLKLK